jgi:hypothetical protein
MKGNEFLAQAYPHDYASSALRGAIKQLGPGTQNPAFSHEACGMGATPIGGGCQKSHEPVFGLARSRENTFHEIVVERCKQDQKHPNLPKYLLHPQSDPTRKQLQESASYIKAENDLFESQKEHSWYGILNEEHKEVFASSTLEELRQETIQHIALGLRLIEAIDAGKVVI